jgi:hypothetical protein
MAGCLIQASAKYDPTAGYGPPYTFIGPEKEVNKFKN